MNTRVWLIFLILLGIFFASYGLLVESPFTADTIDFRAFLTAAMSLATDTADLPMSRVAVATMVLALSGVAIWFLQRVLEV